MITHAVAATAEDEARWLAAEIDRVLQNLPPRPRGETSIHVPGRAIGGRSSRDSVSAGLPPS